MSLNAQYSAGRSGSNILIVPALKGRNVQFCLPRSSCTFCLRPLRSAFVSDLVLVCSSHSAVWWSLAIASHPYTWMMYKYRKNFIFLPVSKSCFCSTPALLPTITWCYWCPLLVLYFLSLRCPIWPSCEGVPCSRANFCILSILFYSVCFSLSCISWKVRDGAVRVKQL